MAQALRFRFGKREFSIPKTRLDSPAVRRAIFGDRRIKVIGTFKPQTFKTPTTVRKHTRRISKAIIPRKTTVRKHIRVVETKPKLDVKLPRKIIPPVIGISKIPESWKRIPFIKELKDDPRRFLPLIKHQEHLERQRKRGEEFKRKFEEPIVKIKFKGKPNDVTPTFDYSAISTSGTSAFPDTARRSFSGKFNDDSIHILKRQVDRLSIHGKPKFILDKESKQNLKNLQDMMKDQLSVQGTQTGKARLKSNIKFIDEILEEVE